MHTNNNKIIIDGKNLTIENLINIAENNHKIDFSEETWRKISEFRKGLESHIYEHPEKPIYGVTRGCGDLLSSALKKDYQEKYIEAYKKHEQDPENQEKENERKKLFKEYLEALENYQVRYIKAHNCGTGNPVPIKIARAVLVIRLNSFAKGHSAMRPETCKLMIEMLNKGVTPWILEEGSVGASGDLVPLAMIGATLIGLPEAKAYYKGELMSAEEALSRAGLKPTKLGAKEAMGLTNGSNLITAFSAFAVKDAEILLKEASISAALSLEAIRGEKSAFSNLIAESRAHKGHKIIAEQMRKLLEESERTTTESQKQPFKDLQPKDDPSLRERIQDRYSFRAIPQVHGATYEAIEKLREVVEIEINSSTDNPLLFKDKQGKYYAISGANFHGQPLATVIDYLKQALTALSLITNKRAFSLLDQAQNFGLPGDLAADPAGGDTGLMITQYAASARAAESRVLSTPSSVMSISTSANQEDFVSMGTAGAIHLKKVIHNTQIIVAVEFLCALRGLQLTYDSLPENLKKLGKGTEKIYDFLNEKIPPAKEDRYLRTDMEKVINLVKNGKFLEIIN
jgi:histidine ammonia-lyase